MVSLCPVKSPDTSIKLHGVISAGQTCHCSEKLRSQPPADNDTSDLFTDTLTIKLLTHTTIRYLNLQSLINQILSEISRTC